MKLETIKDAWYRFCKDFTSLDTLTVIYAEELAVADGQGPRPPTPYLTFRFEGPDPVGDDSASWNPTTEKFEVAGLREYTVSIQAFGSEAFEALSELQTRLNDPSVVAFFSAHKAEIGIVERGRVQNLTGLLQTGFEARGVMDVRFYSKSTDGDDRMPSKVGVIEKVQYQGSVDGVTVAGEADATE